MDLFDAIITNSFALVEEYIESGGDPNVDLCPQLPDFDEAKEENNEGEDYMPSNIKILSNSTSSCISPLRVAIVNCHHQYEHKISSAVAILKSLIDAGADTTAQSEGVILCRIASCQWRQLSRPFTPCGWPWRSRNGIMTLLLTLQNKCANAATRLSAL